MISLLAWLEKALGMGTRFFWLRLFEKLSYVLALIIPAVAKRNLNVIRAYANLHGVKLESNYRIYRQYLFYQLKLLLDMFLIARISKSSFKKNLVMDKKDELRLLDLVQSGQGACIISMHFGNWELGALLFQHYGKNAGSLYFEQLDTALNNWFTQTRTGIGAHLFHQRKGLKSSLEFLKSGGMMTVICDQDGTKNGHFLHFMNLWASFPRSLELFVKHTKAPLLPMLLWHEGDQYRFKFYDEITYDNENPDYASIYKNICNWMQEIIMHNPEQWLLLYDRFKLRHRPFLQEKGWLDSSLQDYQKAWSGESVEPREYK